MSFLCDGTNDYVAGPLTSSYSSPCTIAAFVRYATPVTPVIKAIFSIGSSATTNVTCLRLAADQTANQWTGSASNATSVFAQATTTFAGDDVWVPLVLTCASNTLRTLYVGSFANAGTPNTVSRNMNGMAFLRAGSNFLTQQELIGRVAELAFWNIVLSSTAIDQYCAGTPASSIQAANLPVYIPMSTNSLLNLGTDTTGDLTAFGNAQFDSDHPVIISGSSLPSGRMLMTGIG